VRRSGIVGVLEADAARLYRRSHSPASNANAVSALDPGTDSGTRTLELPSQRPGSRFARGKCCRSKPLGALPPAAGAPSGARERARRRVAASLPSGWLGDGATSWRGNAAIAARPRRRARGSLRCLPWIAPVVALRGVYSLQNWDALVGWALARLDQQLDIAEQRACISVA
jgi:hypothetical protein